MAPPPTDQYMEETHMPEIDERLLTCYHAIFGLGDLHVIHLDQWTLFLRGHSRQRIRTMTDFYDHFPAVLCYILQLFEKYNFIQEYHTRYQNTPGYVSTHVTTEQAIKNLKCLDNAIHEGEDQSPDVSDKISDIMNQHFAGGPATYDNILAVDRDIFAFLTHYAPREAFESNDNFFNTQPSYSESYHRHRRDVHAKENDPPPDTHTHTARKHHAPTPHVHGPDAPRFSPRTNLPALLDKLKALNK